MFCRTIWEVDVGTERLLRQHLMLPVKGWLLEYDGGVIGGFLHIFHIYMYYILWPLAPLECKFLIPNMVSEL
jgi:hypothetical protein